jgi:hypothetical protein
MKPDASELAVCRRKSFEEDPTPQQKSKPHQRAITGQFGVVEDRGEQIGLSRQTRAGAGYKR